MKSILALVGILFLFHFAYGQEKNIQDPLLTLHFEYGFQIPGGDLADDFGTANSISLSLDFHTAKNYIAGITGGIFFGNEIKNDVIASLRGPGGFLLSSNGGLADVILKERGMELGAHLGKLFLLKNAKNRSGVRLTLGLGLFQHKVRIQEDFQADTPQINTEYAKGYDQLTNGLAINEFLGYQYLAADRLINFKVGIELSQAFTQNRRSWDYIENLKIDDPRLDLTYVFKIGWTLPFYFESKPDEIFY